MQNAGLALAASMAKLYVKLLGQAVAVLFLAWKRKNIKNRKSKNIERDMENAWNNSHSHGKIHQNAGELPLEMSLRTSRSWEPLDAVAEKIAGLVGPGHTVPF